MNVIFFFVAKSIEIWNECDIFKSPVAERGNLPFCSKLE